MHPLSAQLLRFVKITLRSRKNMKTKSVTQTFVIALAMMLALAILPSTAFGQNKADSQSIKSPADEQDNDFVGVWEEVDVPAENNCATGLPVPGTPLIRALYSFAKGGTMYVEDNAPFDGPY